MKKLNKKGFTLAELLIVIAIIAILIAIAIPVFGAQLRAARLATDHANIRSAYAWAQSANLMGSADLNADGKIEDTERNSALTTTTTVYFFRDGTIATSASGKDEYTLQVTADIASECQESPSCTTANPHNQGSKITIVYDTTVSGEKNWKVAFAS